MDYLLWDVGGRLLIVDRPCASSGAFVFFHFISSIFPFNFYIVILP